MTRTLPFVVACLATLTLIPAQTYWSENFDIYNPGGLCPNVACANAGFAGGWFGWDNNDSVAGIVNSAFARSGTQSLSVTNTQDAVTPFALNDPTGHPQSGAWVVSAWIYLNSATFATGDQYFIVNNQYNHGGPWSWTGQFKMSPATGLISDDFRTSNVISLVFNRWVEFRFEVDLTNNCATSYYDGRLLSQGPYITLSTVSPTLAIANIDLYADVGGTSVAYYDDLSISVGTGSLWQQNSPAAIVDFDGVTSTGCGPAISSRRINSGSTFFATSNLGGLPYDIAIVPALPMSSILTTPGGQHINVDITSPALFFFNSFSPSITLVPWPGAPIILNLSTPAPLDLSAQMLIIDPIAPDGYTLSQAAGLSVN